MTLLLTPSQLNTSLRRSVWFGILGFPSLMLVASLQGPTMTLMVATALGACAGAFDKWQHDRRLWLMASLFLLLFLPACLGLGAFEVVGSKDGLSATRIVDFAVGTLLLEKMCRVLLSIAVHNRRLCG